MLLFLLACTTDPAETCQCPAEKGDSPPNEESDPTTEESEPTPSDTASTDPGPLQVYLLAGQSNMDGYAYVSGLPPSLQVAQLDVRLYWSGNARWTALAPASFGTAYGVEYFGPEVTFGRYLADQHPERSFALIKHAVGGTDLAQYWYPGEERDDPTQGDGYQVFLATIDAALAELDAAGTDYEIAGMIWMQGEADAYSYLDWANAYEANLTHFISRVRSDMGVPDLPFAIGKIYCPTCVYGDIVRTAEDAVADADPNVYAFDTDDLPIFNDNIHYDGSGMRTLGERFAQALAEQPLSVTPMPALTLTGGFTANYTGNFFLGYTFAIDRPITVTDVGTLDYGGTGLVYASEVAIYDADTGDLLLRHVIPAYYTAYTSPWGGWRYAAIEPVDLEIGSYVIGSQVFYGSEDIYIYNAGFTAAEGFTWVEGRHKEGQMVGWPGTVSALPGNWFGPNLLFTER